MKITNSELNILRILDVRKGNIPKARIPCFDRHSDCFVLVLTGQADYTFPSGLGRARAGDVIYLAKGSDYIIDVGDDYTFTVVDFLFENNSSEPYSNAIYSSRGLTVVQNSFEKLYSLWRLGDFSDKIYCRSLIYSIYSAIVKSNLSEYVTVARRRQIEEVAKYITDNISDCSLSVSQLCRSCDMSEVHFRRLFMRIYHTSPIKFITAARISKAKELLATKNISIAEVAESCGFVNHYYFSKTFKREVNMTPGAYRRFSATGR